ncbi:GNAT family N-acetyltransferase [Niveibacterium sp. 24ML]|uniref:GNAT family N-acetyltransferase n=1 Tax=Niveibacterium sp. 24ML TaxID=2985512 RepID=UPI0022707310|nr:GNAT family N-acetyltransferase [Niveibacterium sp. 24ML]MCX9156748.1 GNAT family N-acetyltransferase [Niveibacterium sp. 24ML]
MKAISHSTGSTAFNIHAYPAQLLSAVEASIDITGDIIITASCNAAPMHSHAGDQPREGKFARCEGLDSGVAPQIQAQLTCLDDARQQGFVLTAQIDGQEELVADACFVVMDDGESAEFALAVSKAWRGKGFGLKMLESICTAARQAGVQRLCSEVAVGNGAMLALMLRSGFSVRSIPGDDRFVRVERTLAQSPCAYRFARRTAQAVEAFTHTWPQWLLPIRFAL